MIKHFLKPKSSDYWDSFLVTLFICLTYFLANLINLSEQAFLLTNISAFLLMIIHVSYPLPISRLLLFSSIYLVITMMMAVLAVQSEFLSIVLLITSAFLAGMLTIFKIKGLDMLGMFSMVLFIVVYKIGLEKTVSVPAILLITTIASFWVYTFFLLLFLVNKKTRKREKSKEKIRILKTINDNLKFSSPSFIHALRLVIASTIGLLISFLLNPHYAYWVVLTIVLVLVFGYDTKTTFKKGFTRASGTILGAILALILISYFHFHPLAQIENILIIFLLFFTFLAKSINQVLFYTILTIVVLFLMSRPFNNLFLSEELLEHRILFTLLGAAIAISVRQILWPKK